MREQRFLEEFIKEEKLRNIFQQVFDERTILAIHELAHKGFLSCLEFIISTGKEAHVYKAIDEAEQARAVKIYKIETSSFRNMRAYIEGDLRFKAVPHDREDIIYAWTRKEYKNLEKFMEAGVRVPVPYAFNKNVLVMEFIGKGDEAAKPIKEEPIADLEFLYERLVEEIAKMVYRAKLVHADLSEYNILNFNGEPVVIDCGQAVLLSHPKAQEFFARDLRNLANYFTKQGLAKTEFDLRADIRKLKGKV